MFGTRTPLPNTDQQCWNWFTRTASFMVVCCGFFLCVVSRHASRHTSRLSAFFVAPATCIGLPDISLFTWILLQLWQRHQNKPRLRAVNLRPLLWGTQSPMTPVVASTNRAARFMLLNTRLLNNKALLIYDIILCKKLDFLCLTET